MPTHAEIEQKLDELMLPPIDGEKTAAINAYFRTLSTEDRMYAAHYGSARADEDMRLVVERWLRG